MDIAITNASKPVALPSAQPLAYLPPGAFPEPTSGVEATTAGIQQGQAVAQPLANMGEFLESYYSPEQEALRNLHIAAAQTGTVEAQQQKAADLQTPEVPLWQRKETGTGAEAGAVGNTSKILEGQAFNEGGGATATGQAAATSAKVGQTEAENAAATIVPADARQYAGYKAAALNQIAPPGPLQVKHDYDNLRAAHPGLGLPDTSDGNVMLPALGAYAGMGDDHFQNKLAESYRGSQVQIAGSAFMQRLFNGGFAGYHVTKDGAEINDVTKFDIQQKDAQGNPIPDSYRTVFYDKDRAAQGLPAYIDPDTREPLPDQNVIPAASIRTADVANRFNINQQNKMVTYGNDSGGDPIQLNPSDARNANQTINNFKTSGNVQAIVKIAPLVDRALSQIVASKNAKTGEIDVDSMLTAARAFRGQVSDTEMKALNNSGGLNNSLYKLDNLLTGKQYDPNAMMADLTTSLNAVKGEGDKYLDSEILPKFRRALPLNARPIASDLFPRVTGGVGGDLPDPNAIQQQPGQTQANQTQSNQAQPQTQQQPTTPTTQPQQAPPQIKIDDGDTATGANGQKIIWQNGKWYNTR